ncbi:hypothetical protein GC163_21930 [bacterium]|nr:hypothetical protein [bacterium]
MVRRVCGPICVGLMVLFGTAGCGGGTDFAPKLAPVTGTITVDGKPAEGLLVTFEPQIDNSSSSKEKSIVGKPSLATTDTTGKYELSYSGGGKGAIVGKHLVRVSAVEALGADAPPAKFKIPDRYNTFSGLIEEVKDGPNTFDMDIKTK